MDAVLLARLQFAFTVGYHFLFVPFSLGVGLILLIATRRAYRSGLPEDEAASRFWLKLFTATFVIGVATGITMEFAFGTNWADYSRFVGDIFGAPLAAEALFSFFLESTFLGVLLFGRGRVSKRFLYISTWLVVLGAHLSALWILIANSWQQTPAGYKVEGGRAVLTDFVAAAVNYSTLWRFLHTVSATWLAGAFVAAAIAAYYLRQGRHVDFAKWTLAVSLILGLAMSAALPLLGDRQAAVVAEHQPMKMAAFEGLFTTEGYRDMLAVGWIDQENRTVRAIGLPDMLSLVLTGSRAGVVPGLDQVPPADWPPLQTDLSVVPLDDPAGPGHGPRHARGSVPALAGKAGAEPPLPLDTHGLGAAAHHRHPAGLGRHRDGTAALDRAGPAAHGGRGVARGPGRADRLHAGGLRPHLRPALRRLGRRGAAHHQEGAPGGWGSTGPGSHRDGNERPGPRAPRHRREGGMSLADVWYVLIAVLLAGYAVLDGFDLGIGTLYPFLSQGRAGAPGHSGTPSARCGTATRFGSSPPRARSLPPSPWCTQPSSAASTWP